MAKTFRAGTNGASVLERKSFISSVKTELDFMLFGLIVLY